MPKIRLHWSVAFLVIIVFWNMMPVVRLLNQDHNVSLPVGFFLAFLYACSLIGAILVHELSHVFVARLFGIRATAITLMLFGGMAQMGSIKRGKPEFFVGLVGPLTSFVIALVAGFAYGFVSHPAFIFLSYFSTLNLVLAIFNILPIFPMDGGRVFRSLLGIFFSNIRATKIAASVGVFGCIALPLGLFLYTRDIVSLLWIGMIMWFFILPVNLQSVKNPHLDS